MADRKIGFFPSLFILLFPLFVGLLSSLLTPGSREAYEVLLLPSFAPPGWVFPVVWTPLLLLLGIAGLLLERSESIERRRALVLWGVTLALIFLWTPLFFRWEAYFSASILAALLFLVTAALLSSAFSVRRLAGVLILPLFLWSGFAVFLSFAVAFLNRT